jgi:peptidoglycan/xylan/chitin deacetylase (PgdA/CDA1 family)
MLRRVRRQLLVSLKRGGFFRVAANSRWRGRSLLILCYHGISLADEHEWNNQLYISPATFRERLDILKRGRYAVLPLDDALGRLAAGNLPPRSVAITFDDGAHDFHERAFPLLRDYDYPATVYLTTYYCQVQRPVFDTAASYLLWRGRHLDDVGRIERLVPELAPLDLTTEPARRAAALRVRGYANRSNLSAAAKDDLLRGMAEAFGLDYDAIFSRRRLHLMTPDEVRKIAAAGIDVQLHTHRHRTPDDCAAFAREIEDNRASIDEILGPGRRTHFCYPSGIYQPSFVGWLREAGVTSATTCDFGLATRADDRLLLPRLVDTGNITPVQFEACLAGVADLLPHRRRAGLARRSSAAHTVAA